MYFKRSLAGAIAQAVKREEKEIRYRMLRPSGFYECVHLEVDIKIEENAVKSFSLSRNNPIILGYELKATAYVFDYYNTPCKTKTVSMSQSIDPELIRDTHHNIQKDKVYFFKEQLLNSIAYEIATHCETKKEFSSMTRLEHTEGSRVELQAI